MKKQKRQRKVGCSYQKRVRGEAKVSSLLLSGKWLEDLGINPGDTAEISVVNDKITIYKKQE